ncbi:MAG: flagellar M-ring protein FliF [Lachnospiraceae bacterium]|nr:flagellar M-ring protein FliF [Lachnospiraceae bacterium]
MQNIKESWQKMSEKTRRLVLGIVAGTVGIALIAILVLTFGQNNDYSVLFSGLSQEEAQQIGSLLQDQQIDFKYNASDGTIRVPEAVVETTRVTLLSQGYPKNGFAYDMYLDNTGLMTTESDKKQITLYELQDRLGATIRSFEGVQEARVNIAEASEQRYVLEDNETQGASASVVITMQNGSVLTEDKAQAVKNLVAHSVRGMNFAEVVVLDGETMLEVGGSSGSGSAATDLNSLTSMVETSIAANIRNVLEKLYGTGSVAVSVKGTLNMEKLIQESTEYSTPEKISEEDKTGLLESEELVNESSQAYNNEAGGVAGTESNADTPRYTNEDGDEEETDSYYDGSASREWLYNVIKEQRQVDPGILEDVSVGVIILTDNTSVPQEDLYRLVANSAGIPVTEANDKITIIRDPGMPTEEEEPILNPPEDTLGVITTLIPLPLLIAIVAGVLLLLLLILFLLLRRRRKKKDSEPEDADFEGGDQLSASDLGLDETGSGGPLGAGGLDDEDDLNSEEIMNLRMQKSMRLKQNIAEFVDQNPQIAAKLVQSWLRGEEETDGRNRGSGRKHSK